MHQNNVEQWILPKNGEDIFKDGRFCTVLVNSKSNTNKETIQCNFEMRCNI